VATDYYRCFLKDGKSLLLGLRSDTLFTHAHIAQRGGGLRICLCRSERQAKAIRKPLAITPLEAVAAADVPEDLRFEEEGELIEAGRPWGGNFMEALHMAVSPFGLTTYDDPYKEGSDSYGMLVGPGGAVEEVASLLEARFAFTEENPEDYDENVAHEERIWAACEAHGVIWLDTDWKHFEIDLCDFDQVGLEANRVEPEVLSAPEGVDIDEVVQLGPKSYVTINVVFRPK
jgi:hypothetical protein